MKGQTRSAEITQGKLVSEGAVKTCGPVQHWEIYEETSLYMADDMQLYRPQTGANNQIFPGT